MWGEVVTRGGGGVSVPQEGQGLGGGDNRVGNSDVLDTGNEEDGEYPTKVNPSQGIVRTMESAIKENTSNTDKRWPQDPYSIFIFFLLKLGSG